MNHKTLKFVFLVILIGVLVAVVKLTGISSMSVDTLQSTIASLGAGGFVVYFVLYAVGTILFFPGTPLTVTAGFLFGPVKGTILVVLSATLGASGAFFVSKKLGKKFVDSLLHEKFRKLDQYDDRLAQNGLLTTLFLRLIPLFPFNGLNFALGLTRIRFKDYFFGTLLGIIPGTFVLVNLGANATDLRSAKFYIFIGLFVLLAISPKLYHTIKKWKA